jgi:hypothetical protein
VLPGIPVPAPPPLDSPPPGPFTKLLGGAQHLFNNAPPLPSVAERVAAIVKQIDFSAPAVTIWVPGTNEYWNKQAVLDAAAGAMPGARVVPIVYQSTWKFSDSVPDGEAVLRGVLDEVAKRRRPGQKVLVAGESQGAWVISNVLADPRYATIVTRAALFGHPGIADHHFEDPHGPLADKVREWNNPTDVVTADLGSHAESVERGIEQFSRLHLLRGVSLLGAFAVQRPEIVVEMLKGQLHRVPLIGDKFHDPHVYEHDFRAGAEFLAAAPDVAPRRRRTRRASR